MDIPNFPHAQFDVTKGFGFLAHYYPHDALKDEELSIEQWRFQSYSPEILNYKEGQLHHIAYFKKPFLKLIETALASTKRKNAILVPVPSSIKHDDPSFSQVPRKKGDKRNRDDRNVVFCKGLSLANPNLTLADILVRVKSKPQKATWTASEHAKSLTINQETAPGSGFSGVFILVDDVCTKGGTIYGAKKVLGEAYGASTIVMLTLGLSKDPAQFQPVG